MSRRRSAAALVLCAIVAFGVASAGFFFFRDNFSTHYPIKRATAGILRAGEVPYWNFADGGGQPLAGNPNALTFYPDNFLYALLPAHVAFNLHFLLHLVAAWLAMRALAQSKWAAWMYVLSGVAISALSFYNLITAVALLPFAFWAARRRSWLLLGCAFGLLVLGTEPVTILGAAIAVGIVYVGPALHCSAPCHARRAHRRRATARRIRRDRQGGGARARLFGADGPECVPLVAAFPRPRRSDRRLRQRPLLLPLPRHHRRSRALPTIALGRGRAGDGVPRIGRLQSDRARGRRGAAADPHRAVPGEVRVADDGRVGCALRAVPRKSHLARDHSRSARALRAAHDPDRLVCAVSHDAGRADARLPRGDARRAVPVARRLSRTRAPPRAAVRRDRRFAVRAEPFAGRDAFALQPHRRGALGDDAASQLRARRRLRARSVAEGDRNPPPDRRAQHG